MRKIIIIGLICILLMGAGYKFSLSQYEEQCYSYKYNITTEGHCKCESSIRYLVGCMVQCSKCFNCPEEGKVYYNISTITWSDECDYYHLIRKATIIKGE